MVVQGQPIYSQAQYVEFEAEPVYGQPGIYTQGQLGYG
jgi:hypothetical protein